MSAPQSSRPAKGPLLLLGLMTLLTFVGPFGIGWTLRGGASSDWPPDRPVEWFVTLTVMGLVALLMVGLIAFGLKNSREIREHQSHMKQAKSTAGTEL